MIYLPSSSFTSNSCMVVRDKDTIRVYHAKPTSNSNVAYTDYFVNSHYLSSEGMQQFNNYSSLPTCMDFEDFSSSFYYRNDLADIMIIFFIILIICVYFPYRIFSRLFGRWLKL